MHDVSGVLRVKNKTQHLRDNIFENVSRFTCNLGRRKHAVGGLVYYYAASKLKCSAAVVCRRLDAQLSVNTLVNSPDLAVFLTLCPCSYVVTLWHPELNSYRIVSR